MELKVLNILQEFKYIQCFWIDIFMYFEYLYGLNILIQYMGLKLLFKEFWIFLTLKIQSNLLKTVLDISLYYLFT